MGKKFKVKVNGEIFDVEVEEISSAKSPISESPAVKPSPVKKAKSPPVVSKEEKYATPPKEKKEINTSGKSVIAAPLPGKILSVKVKKGDIVKKGDLLLTLEAMKMENEIYSSQNGTIVDVLVGAGDYVSTGDKLVVME